VKKKCSKCQTERDLSDFHRHKDSYYSSCKFCKNKYWKNLSLKDPNYIAGSALKKLYGITLAEYEAQKEFQGRRCAICKNPPQKIRLAVDHDHKTGKLRGLLCSNCNTGMGLLKDDAELLERALEYLLQGGVWAA